MDLDEPRVKPPAHDIGMDLDTLSVDELTERIAMLKQEITRLEEAIADESGHRAAADSLFRS